MEYYSDLMQVSPSLFYPALYSWVMSVTGVIALAVDTKRRSILDLNGDDIHG